MKNVHDRLISTADRLSFQVGAMMAVKRFQQAEILAMNTVGICMFLVGDRETSEDLRNRARNLGIHMQTLAQEARAGWLKERLSPSLSAKDGRPLNPEFDEAIAHLEEICRSVQEEEAS